jgi:hypothetical protein
MKSLIRLTWLFLFWIAGSMYLPAVAQVYLHSDAEEKLTSELAAKLEEAEKAHLAAIDAHEAYLKDMLAQERRLIVERSLALRDGYLVAVLNQDTPAKQKDALALYIDFAWQDVFGRKLPKDFSFDYQSEIAKIDSLEFSLVDARSAFMFEISNFTKAPLAFDKYCIDDVGHFLGVPKGSLSSDDPNVDLDAIVDDLKDQCEGRIAYAARALKTARDRFGASSELAVFTDAGSEDRLGELGAARLELRQINAAIEAQKVVAKALNGKYAALEKYAKCEASKVGGAVRIAAIADLFNQLIDGLANAEAGTFAPKTETKEGKEEPALSLEQALQQLNNLAIPAADCAAPAPAGDATAPAPTPAPAPIQVADVLKALKAFDQYALNQSFAAAVKAKALDIQGNALGRILTGLAEAPSDADADTDERERVIARSLLRAIGHLEQFKAAKNGTLPDTAGVLVTLAQVKMNQTDAQIEADRLAELKKLAELRVTALTQRGLQLASAGYSLQRFDATRPDRLDQALLLYGSSWDQGAIPATVALEDMRNGRFLPWLARERTVVEATFAVLKPAVAELEAYGSGGIQPSLIAQLLQAIGVNAIAVQ